MCLWLDRQGQFSVLRFTVLCLLCLPALIVLGLALAGGLGPEPLKAAMKEIGGWTVRLLLVTLAITPATRLLGQPRLSTVRRMIGVATCLYAVLHLVLFVWNEGWQPWHVVKEILTRAYLTIGFVALIGLIALGWTSTDRWMKRLGPKWRRLHSLIWPIGVLALLHFFLQSKSLVFEAIICAGVFAWLLAWRLMPRTARLDPYWLLLLAPVAAATAAAVEYAFFALATRLPADRIFAANFDPNLALRPSHWVLGITLLIPVILGVHRRIMARE